MRPIRAAAIAVALAAIPAVAVVVFTQEAVGHGTMGTPVSRVYQCYLEGPEAPKSAACKQAVAIGGTQPLYDWNEINQANAAGNHRNIIPDGRLCSGGRDKYAGFDQPRADWVATTIPTSGSFTFQYRVTAQHPGTFDLYVTRQGWNPALALKWSDLEATPFLHVADPPVVNGYYVFSGNLPTGHTGRHVIYAIWQRYLNLSNEAFYSCSDVIFGSAPTSPPPTTSSPSPTTSPTQSPTASPTPTATGTYPAWAAWVSYTVGTRVSYMGRNYQCRQSHTSQPGWEPPNAAALWLAI
jgi:chitin-binding protein